MLHIKLAQFAVRCALPPRRSESPACATDNKPSCVLHLLGWFIGSRGFSSLERRPEFWVLHDLGADLTQPWDKSLKLCFPVSQPGVIKLMSSPTEHSDSVDGVCITISLTPGSNKCSISIQLLSHFQLWNPRLPCPSPTLRACSNLHA